MGGAVASVRGGNHVVDYHVVRINPVPCNAYDIMGYSRPLTIRGITGCRVHKGLIEDARS
jgi:hypothetical protein